jgi:AhpD family alkylhydroperoxidase
MPRLNYASAAPASFQAMLGVEKSVRESGLEHPLLHMVKVRASQINGCAYCIDMHWKEARAADISEQRLRCLSVWRDAPFYSERERAALAWTEAVTQLGPHGVPDDVFAAARAQFNDKELASLTWAVAAINAWNRLSIAFRNEPAPA